MSDRADQEEPMPVTTAGRLIAVHVLADAAPDTAASPWERAAIIDTAADMLDARGMPAARHYLSERMPDAAATRVLVAMVQEIAA